MSRKATANPNCGGKRNSKTTIYRGVRLESSYELSLAENLDANGVAWTRPDHLHWVDAAGKKRRYHPDFYLPDYDVFLDPKNDYLIEKDRDKIARVMVQNDIKVIVLSRLELTWDVIKKCVEPVRIELTTS